MNYYKHILIFIVAMLICSCNKQKTYTQEELYEKVSSGVLLVKTNYTQKITISNGNDNYDYNFIIKDGGIKFYENWENINISEITSTSYGTGFLISPNGIVVTNSHVITPKAENGDLIYQSLMSYINDKIIHGFQDIDLYNRQKDAILEQGVYDNPIFDSKALMDVNEILTLLPKTIKRYQAQIKCKEYKIIPNVQEINVAYNNSNIYNPQSWVYCSELVNNSSYDLAIIRMHEFTKKDIEDEMMKYEKREDFNSRFFAKNYAWSNLITNEDFKVYKGWKIVPESKYIFTISEITPKIEEEVRLYMIGYNQGPILANTDTGIKAQITQGNISQNTDDIKIMYSIPALQGSSGSPVLNQYGELVAINFAGLSNTQNFNYGIKVDKLKELIGDTRVKHLMINHNNNLNEKEDTAIVEAIDVIEN